MSLEQIRKNPSGMIIKFSIPAIISMLLTAFITIADGFFMGNYVGKEGIAAVNLGLPIVYLYLGVGLMISIGGVALAGMSLGAGEEEACNRIFRQTVATTIGASVLLSCVMLFAFEPMLSILQAEGQVIGYFREYYGIMLLELPVMVVNSSFGMFIRGEGKPEYYLNVTILNAVLNVALDYLFAGCFSLGAGGIAWASLLAALASLACIVWYFIKRASIYHLGAFCFSGELFVKGILNGSSEFIGEMSTGIAMFAYNFVIMRKIGVDGVTAFTIGGYVAYGFSMLVVGFGQGASPLISFTYGARVYELAGELRRRTSRYVFCAGAAVFLVMWAASGWYGGLFVQGEVIEEMIRSGMVIFTSAFFFEGINGITSFYFTATGRALESAVISLSRGLVVLLACIFTLPALFGMTGVWMAAPVTEAVTLVITLFFLYKDGKSFQEME